MVDSCRMAKNDQEMVAICHKWVHNGSDMVQNWGLLQWNRRQNKRNTTKQGKKHHDKGLGTGKWSETEHGLYLTQY